MKKEQFRNILYGGIIGDAMGVPYEFKKQGTFEVVPDMIGYGTYNQKPGTWSDDTSLTLILMECLKTGSAPESYLDKLELYYHEGYMTPDDVCFDIGIATLSAMKGTPSIESLGNGALMRASPLVYFTWDMSEKERSKEITKWSAITHPNPASSEVCIRYVEFMRSLITKGIDDFKQQSQKEYFKPGSNGMVIDSFLTAVWALHEFDNYPDIIVNTISLGGDTDTNAMIAGTMAGAVYPISQDWFDKLRRKDIIEGVISSFTGE